MSAKPPRVNKPGDIVVFDYRMFGSYWRADEGRLIEPTLTQWSKADGTPGGPVWIVDLILPVHPDFVDQDDGVEHIIGRQPVKIGHPYTTTKP